MLTLVAAHHILHVSRIRGKDCNQIPKDQYKKLKKIEGTAMISSLLTFNCYELLANLKETVQPDKTQHDTKKSYT